MQDKTRAERRIGTEHEAAAYLGLSVHTLRKDRTGARRIPFYRIGSAIRYDLDRLDAALTNFECGGPAPRPTRRTAAVR